MYSLSTLKTLGAIIAFSVLSETAYLTWKYLRPRPKRACAYPKKIPASTDKLRCLFLKSGFSTYTKFLGKNSQFFQTALMLPDPDLSCPSFLTTYKDFGKCNREHCKYLHEDTALALLCRILGLAQKQLDVCVYVFSCKRLCEAILKAHSKGVAVRVIVDRNQMESSGNQVVSLLEDGIPIKWNVKVHVSDGGLMHHKFVIIDHEVLLNGSFNWTNAAALENYENFIVSNERNVVSLFKKKFEKLWKTFHAKADHISSKNVHL